MGGMHNRMGSILVAADRSMSFSTIRVSVCILVSENG